jgi:hypothetical protein
MKKIRLDIDAITVESFATSRGANTEGGVDAHIASHPGDTWCMTCFEDTCGDCSIPRYAC